MTEPSRREIRASARRMRTITRLAIGGGLVLIFAALAVAAVVALAPDPAPEPQPTPTGTEPATPTPTPTPTPTFDDAKYSIDDPASLWVVVNKLRPLNPMDYEPADLVEVPVLFQNRPYLRAEAAQKVVEMFDAFTAETGLKMQAQSAYRSYSTQVSVYNGWVARLGQAQADRTSARPGHSEHQTGLVIDISAVPATCALDQCFADTPQGTWLVANAWKFGFILRYPDGYTHITGYEFEPWHYRYVGVELATEMHERGIATLEEFFGLPPAPDYR